MRQIALRGALLALVGLALVGAAPSEAANITFNMSRSPSDIGRIVDGDGEIDCGSDCSGTYFVLCPPSEPCEPVSVSFTATGSSGYVFDHWTGRCAGEPATCSLFTTTGGSAQAVFRDGQAPSATAQPQLASGARAFNGMTLRASASDNVGVSRVEYLINGVERTESTAGAPWTATLNAAPFSHGQAVSIVARAVDGVGNPGSSAPVAATMDLRADAAFVAPSPATGTLTNAAAITYAITREGSAVCLLGAAPVESPCNGEFTVSPAADGEHTVTIRATDDVGNTTDWSRTLRIDRTAPSIVFADLTAPLPAVPATTIGFSITDANPGEATCKLDAGAPVPCTSSSQHSMEGLSDGQHSLAVTAVDAAGNLETDLALFTVDATAPALSLTGGPAEGAQISAVAVAFAFAVDAGATVQCALDSDSAFGPCSGAGEDRRDGLADGPHTFRVRAIDALGNVATIARGFVIDTVAPTLRLTGGPTRDSTIDSRATEFSFEAEPGAALSCRLDGGSFRACSGDGLDRLTGLADGPHSFTVRATDAAGNATAVDRSFRVNAPGGSIPGSATPRRIASTVSNFWIRGRKYTRVRTLEVRELPAGAVVTLTCRGRGCPTRKRIVARRGKSSKISFTRRFARRLLHPGATITVRIAAPASLAKTVRFTTRRGRFPSSRTTFDTKPSAR